MIYTVPENGVIFKRKPGWFGNPVVMVKVLRDRFELTRKKDDIPDILLFSEIHKVSVVGYDTNNADFIYSVYKKDQSNVSFTLDPGRSDNPMNYIQTKTCLTAYTQYVLGEHFPENLKELEINLSGNLREKAGVTLLTQGLLSIDGRLHPIESLREGFFVDTPGSPTLRLTFLDGTKEKQKYLSSLNLSVIEGILRVNTGHGIDFSKGDGLTRKTANWAKEKYLDENTFQRKG